MKFVRLFPPEQNRYEGYTFVVFITVLLIIASTARSLVHILFPDGGAGVIAGMDLSGPLQSSNRKIPPTRLPQGKMLSCINLVPNRGVRETSQRQ